MYHLISKNSGIAPFFLPKNFASGLEVFFYVQNSSKFSGCWSGKNLSWYNRKHSTATFTGHPGLIFDINNKD